jgi:cyclophilin family peptidyl-prolyl cis-trans isomerase
MTIDTSHTYCAFLRTAHGVIIIELYAKSAPKHVNSFVFLAGQGYFDNITWHRVIAGFVAQTGDPTATGTGGPGYTIPLEIDPALKYSRPGVVGMARTNDPNSAGSQFFIGYAPLPNLDGGYTIFGQVVRGMDVASQISPRDQGEPPGDALISVRTLDAGVTPAR